MNRIFLANALAAALVAASAAHASVAMIPGCADGTVTDYGQGLYHGVCPDLDKAVAALVEKYHTTIVTCPSGVTSQDGSGYYLDAGDSGKCPAK
jgi:hypothetical protein